MRRSPLSAAVAALAVAGLAACGSSAPAAAPAARAGTTAPAAPAATGGAAAPAKPGATAPAGQAGTSAQPQGNSGARPGTGTAPGKKPAAAPTSRPPVVDPRIAATPEEIPIEAKVTPVCVARGGAATLEVKTVEKANLAYVAVYSNGENGSVPPFGHGHGGNEGGQADFRGYWTARWVVSPTAPVGDGYVTVIVGAKQKQRSIDVPFSVTAREGDGCGT